jgi:hypothetical protein
MAEMEQEINEESNDQTLGESTNLDLTELDSLDIASDFELSELSPISSKISARDSKDIKVNHGVISQDKGSTLKQENE